VQENENAEVPDSAPNEEVADTQSQSPRSIPRSSSDKENSLIIPETQETPPRSQNDSSSIKINTIQRKKLKRTMMRSLGLRQLTPIEIDSGENDPSEAGNKDQTVKRTPEKQDIQEKQQEQQNHIDSPPIRKLPESPVQIRNGFKVPPSKPSPRPPIKDRSMRRSLFRPISQETPSVSHLLQFSNQYVIK
jgi:hypothetical protein